MLKPGPLNKPHTPVNDKRFGGIVCASAALLPILAADLHGRIPPTLS